MKKLSRMMVLLLVVVMVVSLFAGCQDNANENNNNNNKNGNVNNSDDTKNEDEDSSKDNNNDENIEESIYNAPGEFPIVKEKGSVTISMFMPMPSNIILENNEWFPYIEDLSGIKIDLQSVPQDSAQEKISLILASQTELPDVFVNGISEEQLTEYGSQGMFVNVKDYWDSLTNMQNIEATEPSAVAAVTMGDGNIYSLLKKNMCFHCTQSQRMWVNQDWLNRLGLDLPTSTDEFYDMLVAFKENDANGNGDPDDEIPFIASTNKWRTELFGFIMQPFNPTSERTNLYLYNNEGTIKCAATEPGFKDGVEYLNKLYSEKLLDEESFSIKAEQIKTLSGAEKGNRIGSIQAGGAVFFNSNDENVRDDFVVLDPIAGPDGTRRTIEWETKVTPAWVVTSDCENVEAALRLGDMFLVDMFSGSEEDLELAASFLEGPTGYILYDDPELKSVAGNQAKYNRSFTFGEPTNKNVSNGIPRYDTHDRKEYMLFEAGSFSLEKILWDAAESYSKYSEKIDVPQIIIDPNDSMDAAEYKTILDAYLEEQLAAFVIGTRNLSQWDEFVQELKDLGMDRYLEIIQSAYDKRYK